MKITTRGRYGLRALLELARCFDGPPVLAGTLAKRERLSLKYLHALLTALRRAGIVRSVRGSAGGFQLAHPPGEIRLREILQAVEGPLSLVDCVARPERCARSADCTARRVWQELSGAIGTVLDGITLETLIRTPACSTLVPLPRDVRVFRPACVRKGSGTKGRPRSRPRRTQRKG